MKTLPHTTNLQIFMLKIQSQILRHTKVKKTFTKLNINGTEWATSETYFHFQKFTHLTSTNPINSSDAAGKALSAAKAAAKNGLVDIPTWMNQGFRVAVMYYVLLYKFTQNEELTKILLDTAGKNLVEYNMSTDPDKMNEAFWAYSLAKRSGINCLGRVFDAN